MKKEMETLVMSKRIVWLSHTNRMKDNSHTVFLVNLSNVTLI